MAGKTREITKEEFCEKTHTSENCWIFKNQGEYVRFWCESIEGREDYYYYFDSNNAITHRFKDMPEYGEVYHAVAESHNGQRMWSMWSTWCQY